MREPPEPSHWAEVITSTVREAPRGIRSATHLERPTGTALGRVEVPVDDIATVADE